uniref:Uncharacterized protein n=1 Tax=Xiphophorus couchianus TaxID=32473 RepID=A0A3B5LHZ6_9TELE
MYFVNCGIFWHSVQLLLTSPAALPLSDVQCSSTEFKCLSGQCVLASMRCDGHPDCWDRSDEDGCTKPPVCTTKHRCPHSKECLVQEWLCDGDQDCKDGSDEKVLCDDQAQSVCSHLCINAAGSYKCECQPGFIMEADEYQCKITVYKRSLSQTYLLKPCVRADSVAVDWLARNLYWIDGVKSQIVAISLTKASVKSLDQSIILDEELDQPRSLALLPQKGLMFWTEIGNLVKIERAGMDGSERKAIVNTSLGWPGGITVDVLSERVFWTDERLNAIGVVQAVDKLSGKNRQVILKRPGQPFAIKVSFV